MAINTAGQTSTSTTSTDNTPYHEQVIVYDATAITATDYTRITTGFKPRRIRVTNLTDRTILEWSTSMPANKWVLHVAAGTITLDTTASALVIGERYFDVLQNATLALILASKTVLFEAWG